MIHRIIVCTECLNVFTYKEEDIRLLDGRICTLPDNCPICNKKQWQIADWWTNENG